MLDINKTLTLLKDGLFEPIKTWKKYLEEEHTWKETAVLLTLPLIVLSTVLSVILSYLFSSYTILGVQTGLGSIVLGFIMAIIGIMLASFVFSYLAGVFGGKHNFNKSFAALSLATIPTYIGSILGALPFIGILVSLALSIVGIVFLYKIIPSYLEVPQEKRILYFIASLFATFIPMFLIASIMGIGDSLMMEDSSYSSQTTSGGFLGAIERQENLVEQAEQDRFTAPTNGKITEQQMHRLYTTLEKTQLYQDAQSEKMEDMQAQMQNKKDLSPMDIAKMAMNSGSLLSAGNAEMEIIKSSGANWAEYTWVKEQLHIAVLQQDINDAVKHNYALYKRWGKQLSIYGYRP
jgi:hypothetical protein